MGLSALADLHLRAMGPNVRHHSLWIDQLDRSERAALSRHEPTELDLCPDILVVGGGILGVATALACTRRGLGKTLLVEAEHIGAGPSGKAAGLLLPDLHVGLEPPFFTDLARRSLEEWRELQALYPNIGLSELDAVGLEPLEDRFGSDVPAMAESLARDELATLIPGFEASGSGFLLRGQAHLNPLQALAVMTELLDAVATGVEVVSVEVKGERIVKVLSSAGTFQPGAVVFCTGEPPRGLGFQLEIPSTRVRGHMFCTDPAPFRLAGMIPAVCTQLPDRRLLIGGSLDVGSTAEAVDTAIIDLLRGELLAALPWAESLAISHAWTCFRPAHPDLLPVVDRVPGISNTWFTSGHYRTGILMAPVVAAEVARWMEEGQPSAEFAELRCERLLSTD